MVYLLDLAFDDIPQYSPIGLGTEEGVLLINLRSDNEGGCADSMTSVDAIFSSN